MAIFDNVYHFSEKKGKNVKGKLQESKFFPNFFFGQKWNFLEKRIFTAVEIIFASLAFWWRKSVKKRKSNKFGFSILDKRKFMI